MNFKIVISTGRDYYLCSRGRFSWNYGKNPMDSVDWVGMNGDLRNVISLRECGRTFYLIIGVSHQFCDFVAQPLHSLASLQTQMLLCFWICKWGDFHSLLLRKFTTGLQRSNDFCQSCVLPCGWIGFLVLDVLSELLGIYVSHMIYQQGQFYFLSIYALIHFLILSLAIFFLV